jgi:hypothetical protein
VISRARWIGALAALTAALAACGGSHRRAAGSQPNPVPGLAAGSSQTSGGRSSGQVRPAPTPIAIAIALPLSSRGPTTCTVYQPRSGTQIVFGSESLNVRVECQAWAASEPGDGYLWGYERAAVPAATRRCSLTDPQRKLTASVIEETDLVPIPVSDRERAASACASIVASGWIDQAVAVRRGRGGRRSH